MPPKPILNIDILKNEAKTFSVIESKHQEPSIFGSTDGKAVGTYFEHKFKHYLSDKYDYEMGNSAAGIDFPGLEIDMKVTSIKQPQSSCPYKSAEQKIFGLGYSLIVFVYEKKDDSQTSTSTLNILHTIFVDKNKTADFQLTSQINQILKNNGNADDLVSLMVDKNLPLDDIKAYEIAEKLVASHQIEIGYLTISNALQWRLQYNRIITEAGKVSGIERIK